MTAAAAQRVPLKTLALPNEHGAWGFLLEPALLGLLLAPSGPGFLLALAVLGALLTQHPLSLVLADRRRGKTYVRTRLASYLALGYGTLTLVSLAAAVGIAGTPYLLIPAVLAAPLALIQLVFDMRNRGRALIAELAGATAMAALASCVLLAGGWSLAPALALWLLLTARNVPSILYVRSRLKLERGHVTARGAALLASFLALAMVTVLTAVGVFPVLTLAAFLVLLVRALVGLSSLRRSARAKVIGFRELGFGLLTVASVAVGYPLGF